MNFNEKFGLKTCDNIVVKPFLSSIMTNGRFSPKIPRFSALHASSAFVAKFRPTTKEDVKERQRPPPQLKRFAKLNKPNDDDEVQFQNKNVQSTVIRATEKKKLVNQFSLSLNELRDYVERDGLKPVEEAWSLRNKDKRSIAAKSQQELSFVEERVDSSKSVSYGVGATKNWAAMLASLARGKAPKAKEEDTCTCLSLTPTEESKSHSFRSSSIRRSQKVRVCRLDTPQNPANSNLHKLSIPSGATCQLPIDYSRKSCPDLLQPCLKITNPEGSRAFGSENGTSLDELNTWTLDDVIIWIQSIGLEELSSIFIGYDITGSDVVRWNDGKLVQMGVKNPVHRMKILNELRKLKRKIVNDATTNESDINRSSASNIPECTCKSDMIGFMTLYDLVKNDRYNRILAYELPDYKISAKFLKLTVNDGRTTIIVKQNISPLEKDDILLELNGIPSNQLATEAIFGLKQRGQLPFSTCRVVVIRRSNIESRNT